MLERIRSRVRTQNQHAAGSVVCVRVWKCAATPRGTVTGHSVWMKVIAGGGQPAAETQCASGVDVHEILGLLCVLPLLSLLTCMCTWICCFCVLFFYSRNAAL